MTRDPVPQLHPITPLSHRSLALEVIIIAQRLYYFHCYVLSRGRKLAQHDFRPGAAATRRYLGIQLGDHKTANTRVQRANRLSAATNTDAATHAALFAVRFATNLQTMVNINASPLCDACRRLLFTPVGSESAFLWTLLFLEVGSTRDRLPR